MFNHPNLRKSVAGGPSARGQTNGPPVSAAPLRFGRLAMCVAVASALAIGVLGTVVYGAWFNQDQQAYAEAMAGARQALGNGAPTSAGVIAKPANVAPSPPVGAIASPTGADPEAGSELSTWSGEVTGHSQARLPAAFAAEAAPAAAAPSATSATFARRPVGAGNSPAQQWVSARPARDNRATPQEHRAPPTSARRKDNPFTRVGLFFRRVSYRQHGNANRQDIYSHP